MRDITDHNVADIAMRQRFRSSVDRHNKRLPACLVLYTPELATPAQTIAPGRANVQTDRQYLDRQKLKQVTEGIYKWDSAASTVLVQCSLQPIAAAYATNSGTTITRAPE